MLDTDKVWQKISQLSCSTWNKTATGKESSQNDGQAEWEASHERRNTAWKHVSDFFDRGAMACLIALSMTAMQGCTNPVKETPSHEAALGDTLVVAGDAEVRLTHAFKPGQPNGLFDGGISVTTNGSEALQAEVNAVCSMPDLPNWPQYDNIYGRWLKDGEIPGVEGGKTDWQLLLYFDGQTKEQGRKPAPAWAERLAQNLCRKGDFQDY